MNKKKIRVLFLSVFIISSYLINLPNGFGDSENTISSEDQDFSYKVQPELLSIMEDSSRQEEMFEIFIMVNPNSQFNIDLPKQVSIIRRYSIIDALLIKTPVRLIDILSKMPEIESIWLDEQYQSDLNEHINYYPLTPISANGINEGYVNFTDEINSNSLSQQGYNGSGVIIAVLDTGVDITGSGGGDLDDFDENTNSTDPKFLGGVSMVPEEPLYYTDLNGRGTYHTGLACGTGNINETHEGVAPGAYYLNVKIFDSVGITYWSFIISGIEWAISHGADILLFATTIPGLYLDPVCEAVNYAVDNGVVVISPIGDDGPGYMSANTPGQAHKAISVGAYDSFTGEVANFSSRGPTYDFCVGPDIIAPGVDLIGTRARIFSEEGLDVLTGVNTYISQLDELEQFGLNLDDLNLNLDIDMSLFTQTMIPSTTYGEEVVGAGNYTRSSGTGAAAALVAGAVAILISAYPLATPVLIQQALMETARSISSEIDDLNSNGAGLIDVQSAFDWLGEILEVNKYQIVPNSAPLIYSGVISSSDVRNVSQFSDVINEDILGYDITSLFSTQAMMSALVISNSTDPEAINTTSIHLPLNQFGIEYTLNNESNFHWFSEFQVVREMHQCLNTHVYQEGYNRYAGVLELDGLYTTVIAETWSYAGEYNDTTFQLNVTNPFYNFSLPEEYNTLNIKDRVTAIKYSFNFINDRQDKDTVEDLSLLSYFKADLYLNETGLISETSAEDMSGVLNFSLDDTVRFNTTTQVLYVIDENNNTDFASADNNVAMGFKSLSHNIQNYTIDEGINLLLNITFDHLDSSIWNSTYDEFTELNGNGNIDPAFASTYHIGDISYGSQKEFTGVLSVGQGESFEDAEFIMDKQINLIKTNVTNYNITDYMVLSSDFNRMGEVNEEYVSNVKIINIGNTEVENSQLIFAINRSNQVDVWEIYSVIFMIKNLNPFEIRSYNASWVPLNEGIYSLNWVFGNMQDYETLIEEENLLSNTLGRNIFIYNSTYYDQLKYDKFMVFPYNLDQNPMKIYAPLDFAIYNLTILAISDIDNVIIEADGIGSNMIIFLSEMLETISSNGSFIPVTSSSKSSTSISNPVTSDDSLIDLGDGEDNPLGDLGDLDGLGDFELPNTCIKDISPYSTVPFLILANPFIPPGLVQFNITFRVEGENTPFYKIPVEMQIEPNRGRIWFDAVHLNVFVSNNLVGLGGLSGITDVNSLNISTGNDETFGSLDELGDLSFDSADAFDISRFIDLNERLDHTWGNFFPLRELWAQPDSNFGKGASLYTIIPFIEMNITEQLGFDPRILNTLSSSIPETSFIGGALGNFTFESDVITTNTINHDVLQFFDALVLNDPEQELLDSEIKNITSWVKQGGTLYVWAEDQYHTNIASLNQLLETFNLRLHNDTFYPGEYSREVSLDDIINPSHFFDNCPDILDDLSITFTDPIEVEEIGDNENTTILLNDTSQRGILGISNYGKGKVCVIGDNDFAKENLLKDNANNTLFAQQLLRWGLANYYDINITQSDTYVDLYDAGFIEANVTNYDDLNELGLMSNGLLFISTYFKSDGTMINAELYGIETPALPMFKGDGSDYKQFYDTKWNLEPGEYYVMMMIDHAAGVSELFYVKFIVVDALPPSILEKYERSEAEYPHYIDIIGIIMIIHMLLLIWYYNFEKYRKRLEIVQLKGDYLNTAKAKISQGHAIIKTMEMGLDESNISELDQIRYLLTNKKKLEKYFNELKDFGESIGEHY